ncbi:ERCC4 domain-containing protein [Lachnospiraceae bacterium 29-91]
MIICDTREQKNQGILKYFESHKIPYIEKKLETGDYMDSDKMDITIDRKRNLGELLKNMCSPDKSRFWREIRRSQKEGIRFIILCEHGGKYKEVKDVAGYKDKYSKVSGRELMERMYAAHIAYGVEFLFCDKRSTGKKIVELLGCGRYD